MSVSGSDERVDAAQGVGPGHPAAAATRKRKPSLRILKSWRLWRLWRIVAFVVLVVLVYVTVISLYAGSGRVGSTGENEEPPAGGVTVVLTQQSINAGVETMSTVVNLVASPELEADDKTTLAQDVNVIIAPVVGEQTISFAQGTIPGTKNAELRAMGEIEKWPFDRYNAGVVIIAYIVTDGVQQAVPTDVILRGDLPGWNTSTSWKVTGDVTVSTPEGEIDWPTLMLSTGRSGSTLAFGLVLLSLMIAMPVLVLFVAITAYRGHRKVEPSFLSWMGAMLFATIPLRTFLPGSPPIGSWIDFLIVLWVIVGLVTGLAIYVRAWVRWGSPSIPPPSVSPTQPPNTQDGTIRP